MASINPLDRRRRAVSLRQAPSVKHVAGMAPGLRESRCSGLGETQKNFARDFSDFPETLGENSGAKSAGVFADL